LLVCLCFLRCLGLLDVGRIVLGFRLGRCGGRCVEEIVLLGLVGVLGGGSLVLGVDFRRLVFSS